MRLAHIAFPCFLIASAVSAQHGQNTVIAKGVGPAPGAVVCRDLATVSAMVDLYAESMEERLGAALTHGESILVEGKPIPPPNLPRHGCALAKAGTKMTLKPGHMVPIVSFVLPSGRTFTGVTLGNMIVGFDEQPAQPSPREVVVTPEIKPNAIARPVGSVPGALICNNLNTLVIAYKAFDRKDQRGIKDALSYGCNLLAPGTSVQVLTAGSVDTVQTIMDGRIVRGQTFPEMVSSPGPHD